MAQFHFLPFYRTMPLCRLHLSQQTRKVSNPPSLTVLMLVLILPADTREARTDKNTIPDHLQILSIEFPISSFFPIAPSRRMLPLWFPQNRQPPQALFQRAAPDKSISRVMR